jgi:hypothetical protein
MDDDEVDLAGWYEGQLDDAILAWQQSDHAGWVWRDK